MDKDYVELILSESNKINSFSEKTDRAGEIFKLVLLYNNNKIPSITDYLKIASKFDVYNVAREYLTYMRQIESDTDTFFSRYINETDGFVIDDIKNWFRTARKKNKVRQRLNKLEKQMGFNFKKMSVDDLEINRDYHNNQPSAVPITLNLNSPGMKGKFVNQEFVNSNLKELEFWRHPLQKGLCH